MKFSWNKLKNVVSKILTNGSYQVVDLLVPDGCWFVSLFMLPDTS